MTDQGLPLCLWHQAIEGQAAIQSHPERHADQGAFAVGDGSCDLPFQLDQAVRDLNLHRAFVAGSIGIPADRLVHSGEAARVEAFLFGGRTFWLS